MHTIKTITLASSMAGFSKTAAIFLGAILQLTMAVAGQAAEHDHGQGMPQQHMPAITQSSPLTEAGNDAFATLQEVIEALRKDPATDWSKVDLEALRQHLIDMRNFTLNVDVLSKTPLPQGVRITIRPKDLATEATLDRVLPAHAAQLQQETDWRMKVEKDKQLYVLEVTTEKPEDVTQVRGLGYIGIMASGGHHQLHHWLMATGHHPHAAHQ